MMTLRMSHLSPYSRKCRIVAIEAGLGERIQLVPTSPYDPATDLIHENPLCQIPVLKTEDGECYYDSPVICEVLDALHDGPALIPAAGPERWRHRRWEALCDGILDSALLIRTERAMRPKELTWAAWVDGHQDVIARGLDVLNADCAAWGDEFRLGQIAAVSVFGYLDYRAITEWRPGRAALAAWYEAALSRPSVIATLPRE